MSNAARRVAEAAARKLAKEMRARDRAKLLDSNRQAPKVPWWKR